MLLLGDVDGDEKLKGFLHSFGRGGFHRHAKEGAPRSFVMARSMADVSASSRVALPSFSRVGRSGKRNARRSVALTWVWPLNWRK